MTKIEAASALAADLAAQPFNHKASAIRGAQRALKNPKAVLGQDFDIFDRDGKFYFKSLPVVAPAPAKVIRSKHKNISDNAAAIIAGQKPEVAAAEVDDDVDAVAPAKADKPAKTRAPKDDSMIEKIIELACRKQGVSRKELIELTGRQNVGWTWYLASPKNTGIADRHGYTMEIIDREAHGDEKACKAYRFAKAA